ncbi:hypothetical protein [Profundibacterium mesophilum]|uniref:Alkaline proteinase inhibitor/ Outer membrane lipoprotein Omp19 domain-containing protein n=1 Tax=Profundibacterium mesophilum KAUST100406-0324 TaxID=1037889 RepID=A0A921TCP9_9RHOB|nr:hypothetical protein [Profundibacterium mesophilum]KAF0675406.1 hypothetical protein PMES_02296 [Profundibacterium mesophilum KAUST100406-0324]
MRGMLLAALLLAGCGTLPDAAAPLGGAEAYPEAVLLYRDTATVRFSDGQLCTAARPAQSPAGGWSVPLAGCGHGWRAEIARPAGSARPRVPLREGAGARLVLTAPGGAAFAYGAAMPEA